MRHHGLGRAWRTLGIGALVGMSTLLLVACSSDDDGADTETTTTSTATTEATTTTEATASASATEAPTETAAATEAATESPAAGGTTISVATEGDLAPYLVGPEGLTLYMFTNDADGVSNCSGQCATNWPPLVVADGEDFSGDRAQPGNPMTGRFFSRPRTHRVSSGSSSAKTASAARSPTTACRSTTGSVTPPRARRAGTRWAASGSWCRRPRPLLPPVFHRRPAETAPATRPAGSDTPAAPSGRPRYWA